MIFRCINLKQCTGRFIIINYLLLLSVNFLISSLFNIENIRCDLKIQLPVVVSFHQLLINQKEWHQVSYTILIY